MYNVPIAKLALKLLHSRFGKFTILNRDRTENKYNRYENYNFKLDKQIRWLSHQFYTGLIYRVTHKSWDFKDKCLKFVLSIFSNSWLPSNVNLFFLNLA